MSLLFPSSLNWQHQLCKNPRPNPDIKTLFVDHTCGPPTTNGMPRVPLATGQPNANSVGPKPGAPFQLGPHAVRGLGVLLSPFALPMEGVSLALSMSYQFVLIFSDILFRRLSVF